MLYKELINVLNEKNIVNEYEEVDNGVYQVAFKLENQINVYIYEGRFIKIFMGVGEERESISDEILSEINKFNSSNPLVTLTTIENFLYLTTSIIYISDIKSHNIIESCKMLEEVYNDKQQIINEI